MRRITPLLLALLLGGCNLTDLTPASEVVRTRVAAIKASPAEIALGESTTLEALLVHPRGEPPTMGAIWFACLESGGATGCLGLDFGALAGGDDDDSAAAVDPTDFQFGVGETFTYSATGRFIEDAWADLDPEDRVEGLSVLISVNFVARSNDDLQALLLDLGAAQQAGDDAELERIADEFGGLLEDGINAARRVIVSDKTADEPDPVTCPVQELAPNANPTLAGLLLHTAEEGRDSGFPVGEATFVAPEASVTLRPVLEDASIEDYLYIDRDGVTQCRVETPYFAWLTNGPGLARDNTFIADAEDLEEVVGRPKVNSLELPARGDFDQPVDLWLVVRDRRGGVDWDRWTFRPTEE